MGKHAPIMADAAIWHQQHYYVCLALPHHAHHMLCNVWETPSNA